MGTADDHFEDTPADSGSFETGCVESSKEVIAMEKLKARAGVPHDPSGISPLFWAVEEEDVESAPRDMKLKWKRLLQKRTASSTDFEGDLVTGEDGDSKWLDLPMELLVRIMTLVDNRTIVVASGVCNAWRDALRHGILDLSFSWCGRNVSNLVQSLAPKFSKLSSCNLRRCLNLNDSAIEALGDNMHELRILDLTNGTRLTDRSLVALAKGCLRLEKLNLSGCLGITEVGLVALAKSCTNLRQLNLCGCDNAATDKALTALAEICTKLQYLNVGWCERITDVGVVALACGCSELRVMDLCGCHLITDRSVMVLADRCLRLRVLNLYRCQNITDISMYALAEQGNLYRRAERSNSKWSHGSGQMYTHRGAIARGSSRSYSGTRSSSSSSSSNSSYDSVTNQQSTPRGYIETLVSDLDGYGLVSLNLSGCRALSARAVQAVCNAYPALHTCPERCSLNVSGCLNLTSVHCLCGRERVSRASEYKNQAPPLHPRYLPV
ncbi:unnamed protein product [Calypogeia fissa]